MQGRDYHWLANSRDRAAEGALCSGDPSSVCQRIQTGRNITTTYTYDELNRISDIAHSDGTAMSYRYDVDYWGLSATNIKGRLTLAWGGGGGFADLFSYDAMGRLAWERQCPGGECKIFSYVYNRLGEVLVTYAPGIEFTNTYDLAGRLTKTTSSWGPTDMFSNAQYNEFGALTSAVIGPSSVNESRTYSARGFLNSLVATRFQNGAPVYSLSNLTYADNGSLTGATDSTNGQWSYTYDEFNRLKTSIKSGTNVPKLQFNYDRFGNRWSQVKLPGSGEAPEPNFSFNANNRIDDLMTYDGGGNITNDGAHSYTYDAEGRLLTVDGTAAVYTYDPLGRRIKQVTQSGTKYFIYDQAGRRFAALNPDGSTINMEVYAGARHVATYQGQLWLNLGDWLGTERLRADDQGYVYESFTSLPFGDGASSIPSARPSFFTGHDRDEVTGLDHTLFRQYSSTQGRWLTPDPAGVAVARLGLPQSLNRYTYVTNSPTLAWDRLGLNACPFSGWDCGAGLMSMTTWHGDLATGGMAASAAYGTGAAAMQRAVGVYVANVNRMIEDYWLKHKFIVIRGPGETYYSRDMAGAAAAKAYSPQSSDPNGDHREYAGSVYGVGDGTFSYTAPTAIGEPCPSTATRCDVNTNRNVPVGTEFVGGYHTHPWGLDEDHFGYQFGLDSTNAERTSNPFPIYVGTPSPNGQGYSVVKITGTSRPSTCMLLSIT